MDGVYNSEIQMHSSEKSQLGRNACASHQLSSLKNYLKCYRFKYAEFVWKKWTEENSIASITKKIVDNKDEIS